MVKLSAKIAELGAVDSFIRTLTMVAKLSKVSVLRFGLSEINFAHTHRESGYKFWCAIPQDQIFSEYSMCGVSADQNEILIEISSDELLRAVKSGVNNLKLMKMRLTVKNDIKYLSFEIRQAPFKSIIHDVPIGIVSRRIWSDYSEPNIPNFNVSIYLPSIKMLLRVLCAMKNLGNHVILSANYNGQLRLQLETTVVTVATFYRDLDHPRWNDDNVHQRSRVLKQYFWVRVDVKLLHQFLLAQQGTYHKIICNIVHKQLLHFFTDHEELKLQYFLPGITK